MLTRESIIHTLQSALPVLQKKYSVGSIALFGSYSRNEALNNSDVDLLVDFKGSIGIRFIDLADELEYLLHKKVDLVSRKALKGKYLKAIESELIYV